MGTLLRQSVSPRYYTHELLRETHVAIEVSLVALGTSRAARMLGKLLLLVALLQWIFLLGSLFQMTGIPEAGEAGGVTSRLGVTPMQWLTTLATQNALHVNNCSTLATYYSSTGNAAGHLPRFIPPFQPWNHPP